MTDRPVPKIAVLTASGWLATINLAAAHSNVSDGVVAWWQHMWSVHTPTMVFFAIVIGWTLVVQLYRRVFETEFARRRRKARQLRKAGKHDGGGCSGCSGCGGCG